MSKKIDDKYKSDVYTVSNIRCEKCKKFMLYNKEKNEYECPYCHYELDP